MAGVCMKSKKQRNKEIRIGDKVKLTSVPAGLLTDLPEDEQLRIMSSVGKYARITEIDCYGYFGVDCSAQLIRRDRGREYRGHFFFVDKTHLEKGKPRRKKLRGESILKRAKMRIKGTGVSRDDDKAIKMLKKLLGNSLLLFSMEKKAREDAIKALESISAVGWDELANPSI